MGMDIGAWNRDRQHVQRVQLLPLRQRHSTNLRILTPVSDHSRLLALLVEEKIPVLVMGIVLVVLAVLGEVVVVVRVEEVVVVGRQKTRRSGWSCRCV